MGVVNIIMGVVRGRHHQLPVGVAMVPEGSLKKLEPMSRGRGQCSLSGVGRCPPLGGFLSTSSMGMLIGGTKLVRCREVVRFSEGPLLEVLLYRIRELRPTLANFYHKSEWSRLKSLDKINKARIKGILGTLEFLYECE